jgi:hypothetical protein
MRGQGGKNKNVTTITDKTGTDRLFLGCLDNGSISGETVSSQGDFMSGHQTLKHHLNYGQNHKGNHVNFAHDSHHLVFAQSSLH